MKIAVIPARGGSKRIPRKNVLPFAGKPMLAWPIAAALGSKLFDQVIVSTDDSEIAVTAQSCGAEVPFMRPASLSDDFTATIPVVAHAVEWAVKQGWEVDAVCCIYPTAPMIAADDLKQGLELLNLGPHQFVFSATEFPSPIFRAFTEEPDGQLKMVFPEHFHSRSQDLPIGLHDAAQFYWGTPNAWLTQDVMFGPHSTAVRIPKWRVQDIDTPEDWTRAEAMFVALGGEKS